MKSKKKNIHTSHGKIIGEGKAKGKKVIIKQFKIRIFVSYDLVSFSRNTTWTFVCLYSLD